MRGISKLKSYIFAKDRCFIPRCRARCCGDAPLPEDFLSRLQSQVKRPIYRAVNIGHNGIADNYNSVVYNTRPVPLILSGIVPNGGKAYLFYKNLAKKMNIDAKQAQEILNSMEARRIYNYCPFLNEKGRCSVYSMRPSICREFGTSALKINHCSDKSSRYDIFKYYLGFLNPIEIFKFYKTRLYALFNRVCHA